MGSGIWRITRAAIVAAVIASGADAQPAPSGPVEVGVIDATLQDVPRVVTLPGRAVASQEVEMRPRVGGVIEEILYTPGALLQVGDPLFRIDDAAYLAAEASAQADLATAQANLPVAQSTFERAEQLSGRGYTEAEVDTARASLAEAKATLAAAQAALDYARTEMSWTTIKSPVVGRAEVATVSIGDLVTENQSDELTTIIGSDPIYVDLVEASARMLSIRQEIHEGTLTMNDVLEATLVLETGEVYRGTGTLVTPGNIVSTTTGTFTVRFEFDNPHNLVLPGMFLRGEIMLGTSRAFLVPQRAATRGNSGLLTAFVVGDDGTAQQITLTDEGTYENSWIVRGGLNEGDKLIVDGLPNIQAGQAVTPVPSVIDENGIVRDADTASED